MARIISIVSNKGGAGKTLTTKFLSDYAAKVLKKRVLMIDLDPQTNLSKRYLDMQFNKTQSDEWSPPPHPDFNPETDEQWEQFPTSANIWTHGNAIEYKTDTKGLYIFPGSSQMLQLIEEVDSKDVYKKVIAQFKDFLKLDDVQNDFDYIFIDTRPSKGPLVRSALNASDYALIPSEMEAPSTEGVMGMLQICNLTNSSRSQNNKLKLIGILPNKVRPIRLHQDNLTAFRESEGINQYILPCELPDLVAYKESMSVGGRNIFDFPKQNKARVSAGNVMKCVFKRIEELS